MEAAWADETYKFEGDPGMYAIAAVLTLEKDLDRIRDQMGALLQPGQKKLHWRDDRAMQPKIFDAVCQLPVIHLVVVRSQTTDSFERSRKKCLSQLIRELDYLGCQRLTMESRGSADDNRDMSLVKKLRAKVRVTHLPGPEEPALWVADAVCGVVRSSMGGDDHYLREISSAVQIVEVAT